MITTVAVNPSTVRLFGADGVPATSSAAGDAAPTVHVTTGRMDPLTLRIASQIGEALIARAEALERQRPAGAPEELPAPLWRGMPAPDSSGVYIRVAVAVPAAPAEGKAATG